MHAAPLRVGLVGYGFAGRTFHAPLIAAAPGLALAAVASSDAAKVHADWPGVRVHARPQSLLEDEGVDLVVIASPNEFHAPLARAALQAGRHVVVDKPFTLTLEEAVELTRLARARARVLSVFHNRRLDGDFLTVRSLVERSTIGRIVGLESRFDRFRPEVRARWREGAGAGAGLWYDLGPHLVDQALALFGWPEGLEVTLLKLRDGALADDAFVARLHYPRCLVTLQAGMLVAATLPRFVLHGTLGSFSCHGLDPQEDALRAGLRPGGPASDWGSGAADGHLWMPDAAGAVRCQALPLQRGDYPAYYGALHAAVHGQGPNPVPAEEAVEVMALIEAGIDCDRARRALPAPPRPRP